MTDNTKPQPTPAAPAAERTQYRYKNGEGHRVHVSTVGADRDHVELAIAGVGDLDWRSLNVPAAEVPGIALALLKAAGVQPHAGTALHIGDRRDMWAVRYLTDHVEAQAEDAAEAAIDTEALTLARAWFNVPDADWGDLTAIRTGIRPQAIRAAEAARRIHEATQ